MNEVVIYCQEVGGIKVYPKRVVDVLEGLRYFE
jgi:hypothetical protein